MAIEIDLGERFGRITIERKRSVSMMLADLQKDKQAIKSAVDRYARIPSLVHGRKNRGAEGMAPPEILISKFDDKRGVYSDFLLSNIYKLSINEDGELTERAVGFQHVIDVNHLPDWFLETVSRDKLEKIIKQRFYPKRPSVHTGT